MQSWAISTIRAHIRWKLYCLFYPPSLSFSAPLLLLCFSMVWLVRQWFMVVGLLCQQRLVDCSTFLNPWKLGLFCCSWTIIRQRKQNLRQDCRYVVLLPNPAGHLLPMTPAPSLHVLSAALLNEPCQVEIFTSVPSWKICVNTFPPMLPLGTLKWW